MPQPPRSAPSDRWPMVNLGIEKEVAALIDRPGRPGYSVVGRRVPAGQWIAPQQLSNGDKLAVRFGRQVAVISGDTIKVSNNGLFPFRHVEPDIRIAVGAHLTDGLVYGAQQPVSEVVLVSGASYPTSEADRVAKDPILEDYVRKMELNRPGVRAWEPLDEGDSLDGVKVLIGEIQDQAMVGTLKNFGVATDSFGLGDSYGGLIFTQNDSAYSFDNRGRVRQVVAAEGTALKTGNTTFQRDHIQVPNGSTREFSVTLVVGQPVFIDRVGPTSAVKAVVTDLQLMPVGKAHEVTGGAQMPASYPTVSAARLIAAPTPGPHFGETGR